MERSVSQLIRAMKKLFTSFGLTFSAFFLASTAIAAEPICNNFSSKIEPDMQRQETDFTHERFVAAQENMRTTIREWMESEFERNKKNSTSNGKLFDGEIWLAQANTEALINGYVLKLEYLSASAETKENARQAFCKFLIETPYYD
jgi:hypothetical protein